MNDSSSSTHRPKLNTRDLMRLSLRGDVSLEAARRWSKGDTNKPRIAERIERAARELGFLPPKAA